MVFILKKLLVNVVIKNLILLKFVINVMIKVEKIIHSLIFLVVNC